MNGQREAIPEHIPQHPSGIEEVAEGLSVGQLMDGGGIDMSIIMKWAEYVNEYAYELTPPPELPTGFEDLTLSQVRDIPLSECSAEEIVMLIGWYWYHSGENEAIFHKDNPEEKQNEHQTVEDIKKEYRIIHRFDTKLDRININALAMSIYSEESDGIDWDGFNRVEGSETEGAVFYPPTVEDTAVLIFNNGRGYYCCQSDVDVKPVDQWFRTEFENWSEEGIVPLQLDSLD